jgi:hypothetical protein
MAAVVEATLSLALREVFAIMTVDRFKLTAPSSDRLAISMGIRAPLGYAEVPLESTFVDLPAGYGEAAALVESVIGLALADLFGTVDMEDVHVEVNQVDQVTCTILAHVPISLQCTAGDGQEDSPELSTS